jgi:hypothetical protein
LHDHLPRLRPTIDGRRVVHETIDGEVILIQLETGYYYSLDGIGAEVWTRLVAGLDAGTMVAELSATQGADTQCAVCGLLHELHAEQLIVVDPADVSVLAELSLAGDTDGVAKPALQKYTDMEDFMLVDPVHDVDERGWPNRAANAG